MEDKALENINKIEDIKVRLKLGVISYDQAKVEATPIIEAMNRKGSEIAKKHKQKFRKFSFVSLMR